MRATFLTPIVASLAACGGDIFVPYDGPGSTSTTIASTDRGFPEIGPIIIDVGDSAASDTSATDTFISDWAPDYLPPPDASAICVFGGYLPQVTYYPGVVPWSIAIGDFDGDGKLDFAIRNTFEDWSPGETNPTPIFSVMLNANNGAFGSPLTYAPVDSGPQFVLAGDFNGDGLADILISDPSGGVDVLLNAGNASFPSLTTYASIGYPAGVADFNGDGLVDFLVLDHGRGGVLKTPCTGPSSLEIFISDGHGGFATPVTYAINATNCASEFLVGDVNGDGYPDVVAFAGTIEVLFNQKDGTFSAPTSFPQTPFDANPGDIVLADINHDGLADFVVAGWTDNALSVLYGHGDGSFEPPVAYAASYEPAALAVGDINGDGYLDVVVATTILSSGVADNHVSVYLNDGTGAFATPVSYAVGSDPSALAIADFNSDGMGDLAVSNEEDGTVSVLFAECRPQKAF